MHNQSNKQPDINTKNTTAAVLQSIHNITENNSIRVSLNRRTRTTRIIDDFASSCNDFLVFKGLFSLSKPLRRASLVVAKYKQTVEYVDSRITMTDLKNMNGYIGEWLLDKSDSLNQNVREYELLRELVAINEIAPLYGTTAIPFKMPHLLRGQTFDNQTGFGSEYLGNGAILQGKLYGETTRFLIIGVLIEY